MSDRRAALDIEHWSFSIRANASHIQMADGIDIGHKLVAFASGRMNFFCMLRCGCECGSVVRANCSSKPIPWRSRRSQSSPWSIPAEHRDTFPIP